MSNELENIYLILSKDVSFALDMERLMVADLIDFSGPLDALGWSPIEKIDARVLCENLGAIETRRILSRLLRHRPESIDEKSKYYMRKIGDLQDLLPPAIKVGDMEPGKLFRILDLPGYGDLFFLDSKENILQLETDGTIATLYRATTEMGYKDLLNLEVIPLQP